MRLNLLNYVTKCYVLNIGKSNVSQMRYTKKIREGKKIDLSKQPKDFKLGTGHVIFFYDKLKYLHERYNALRIECINRGFNMTDYNGCFEDLPPHLYNDWTPTSKTREIVLKRINERLQTMKRIKYYSEDIEAQYISLSE